MNSIYCPCPPTLAFTAASPDCAARLQWVSENAVAVEFSPDPERLDLLPEIILPFRQAGLPIRFHTRYFQYELGHADPSLASAALEVHQRSLVAMAGLSEPVVTVHSGLNPDQPVHMPTLVDNLSRLVEFAGKLGMIVCLENLRTGHSSDPRNIASWAAAAGAMITLDIGHALGSASVQSGSCTVEDFVDLFAHRLWEVHIYGREDESGHHPIDDMEPFEPIIARLLETRCSWWTVELQDADAARNTREMIRRSLQSRFQSDARTRANMHAV
ncbi:sugar phosphate isomerase/epimerase family protein [Desulfonatronum thiosulfatophilum]|nr:TIM barrel protein [Desulfonatronum thiosulfatophilum]